MGTRKELKIYYLLITEGATELNIFSYLKYKKFREVFTKSNIRFSNKIEIIKNDKQIVSQGNLCGVGNIGDFKTKYALIKKDYLNQRLFFMLDKDLDDSSKIEAVIKNGGDIIQSIEYNSEYLLLKFAGMNPKQPSDFSNMGEFRKYSKSEFKRRFSKETSELKDNDLDLIFKNTTNEEIKDNFTELFLLLSK